MSAIGTPTYDQLTLFLAVVDEGSFAAAARRLGRAVSAVSYGISNLEAQLGLALFDRAGTRRPVLTEAGRAVLAEARAVARGMDGLRARAKGLHQGLEAEVSLVVDVMLPPVRLGAALRAFNAQFPTVALRLHVEALGAVTAKVLAGEAVIGINGPLNAGTAGLDWTTAGAVELVPVAAPDHPLAMMSPTRPGAARDHIQLVLSDRSPLTSGRDFSVLSPRTWRLADLGAKHALLRQGIGWGNMPLPLVEADLLAGTLVRLALPDWPAPRYSFSAIWRTDTPPGPAACWLVERFIGKAPA
ncbi:MAG TPA: LysR family transcriptional regulator [Sphingobium sp.]|nr:LysR family transcriptional regulator [Sphingobium sp.]